MSASREKKTRQDEIPQGPTDRELKKQQEAKEARRSTILYSTVGIICAVLAVFLLVWNSGLIQRNVAAVTIKGEKYTTGDLQYYFNSARSTTLNFYMEQIGMPPFDYNSSTKDQIYDPETGETWYEYLLGQAKEDMAVSAAIAAKAEAEGFTITEESQQQLDDAFEELQNAWVGTQYTSLKSYIRAVYGAYMDYDRLVELTTRDQLVRDYIASVSKDFTYDEADYMDYYNENRDTLDTFDLVQFTLQAKVSTKDEEGNTIEMTDEEKAEALEKAKADAKAAAEEIMAKLKAGADVDALTKEYEDVLLTTNVAQTRTGSNVNSAYSEWAFDSARQEGDVTLSEFDGGATSFTYYVVRFDGRHLDESSTSNVRHILVKASADKADPTDEEKAAALADAKAEAQKLLDDWKAGEATEESFAALAKEHSADAGSAADGGLIPNISAASNYVENFKNWAIDPSRQAGDTGLVESNYGWHIMYYVESGDPVWTLIADDVLRSEEYSAWEDSVSEGYEVTDGMGVKFVQG